MRTDKSEYVFALVGNPNSGKTTLFNELTGSRCEVGNRAGVTVECKSGMCKSTYCSSTDGGKPIRIRIVDLPGIYSLSPNSEEEIIARDYILNEKPDLILNIIDASNLARNLYLTTQLAEMGTPIVAALNMMDALKENGFSVDVPKLSKKLGINVMPVSAAKCIGIHELAAKCADISIKKHLPTCLLTYGTKLEKAIKEISQYENLNRLCAVKLIEHDFRLTNLIKSEKTKSILKNISENTDDIETYMAEQRYKFIKSLTEQCITITGTNKQAARTNKIDSILTHPIAAIPIFFAIMFLIFKITFGKFGTMLSDLADNLFNVQFASLAETLLDTVSAGLFAKGIIIDGIIAGVGNVVTFFPQIMLLFLLLSFLEDSGYMARTSFIMDKLFMKAGLSGKSIIPMIMGFGCSVPAIMSVRTLENERDRKLTLLLLPFMSCGAKMPVYAMFTAVFFPEKAAIVTFSLYMIGIFLAIISGIIFSHTVLKGDIPPFVLEMPPYRMPSLKSTLRHMWEKAKDFAMRAGTVLLLASIIIWLLQNLDFHLRMVNDSRYSILGITGQFITPVFKPCGFGTWQAAVSLMSGFAAKEAIVSSITILCGAENSAGLMSSLSHMFTPLSAYSFLIFVLLYVPCTAAVSALATELNSKKLTVFSVCYQLGIAWIMSTLVFQIGRLFV